MVRMHVPFVAAACGAASLSVVRLACAQPATASSQPPVAGVACGADSMYARVPVFVRATVHAPTDSAALRPLLRLGEDLSLRIRRRLGGSADLVPDGDGAMRPSGAPAQPVLHVHVPRDGAPRWDSTPDSGAAALLTAALAAARDANALDALRPVAGGDTLAFDLDLVHATVDGDGRLREQLNAPAALQAFTLRVPRARMADVVTFEPAAYPRSARRRRGTGAVVLSFVVDTAGRIDPASMRDEWPPGEPHPAGERAALYEEFVGVARAAALRATYRPARVAGCAIPQRVEMPFAFTVER